MTHPTPKDWREEVKHRQKEMHNIGVCKCCDNAQTLLDQHSAHLVERILEIIDEYYIDGDWQNNQTLNRIEKAIKAIDIINNKTE